MSERLRANHHHGSEALSGAPPVFPVDRPHGHGAPMSNDPVQAEIVLPCGDLTATLAFFTEQLGFPTPHDHARRRPRRRRGDRPRSAPAARPRRTRATPARAADRRSIGHGCRTRRPTDRAVTPGDETGRTERHPCERRRGVPCA
ncbi:MAG: hypothetical protein WKF58_15310 [Ilumatobacteraceae bacterium]